MRKPIATQANDAELVRLTRAGDQAAFGELVRRYQGLVYGLAYHRVGSFTDAQDIAQEVFVRAYRSLDQLREPEKLAAWLKAVTVNECRMWQRASRSTISLDEAETLPSYASVASESWRRGEKQADVRRAVDSLPERSRLVVTLHYLSGLSHREIGEFLGVAANAVAQHLHRARRQLKELLMAEIEEDYAMNKLPGSFAEEVLRRVDLHPMVEGMFMTATGEGDARGLMVRVGDSGQDEAFITIWMHQEDLDDVVLGTLPMRRTEKAKGRAMESLQAILRALGAEIEQVVLRMSEPGKCRAEVSIVRNGDRLAVDMRPSDAISLAARSGAPVCAEEPVVRQGSLGEDDVSPPSDPTDHSALRADWEIWHRLDQLRGKAFELGLSPEDLVDTAHYCRDEARGVMRMWLEAYPEREHLFDLVEYAAAFQRMADQARPGCEANWLVHGGKRYDVQYLLLGDDVRIRITPRAADAPEPPDVLLGG